MRPIHPDRLFAVSGTVAAAAGSDYELSVYLLRFREKILLVREPVSLCPAGTFRTSFSTKLPPGEVQGFRAILRPVHAPGPAPVQTIYTDSSRLCFGKLSAGAFPQPGVPRVR